MYNKMYLAILFLLPFDIIFCAEQEMKRSRQPEEGYTLYKKDLSTIKFNKPEELLGYLDNQEVNPAKQDCLSGLNQRYNHFKNFWTCSLGEYEYYGNGVKARESNNDTIDKETIDESEVKTNRPPLEQFLYNYLLGLVFSYNDDECCLSRKTNLPDLENCSNATIDFIFFYHAPTVFKDLFNPMTKTPYKLFREETEDDGLDVDTDVKIFLTGELKRLGEKYSGDMRTQRLDQLFSEKSLMMAD